jgi:signal transduction histidine kinase
VADDFPTSGSDIGKLLGLLVHDLRNPTATVGANLTFLKEAIEPPDDDTREAFEDAEIAVDTLMKGLEQVGWIARALAGQPPVQVTDGDVVVALRTAAGKLPSMQIELDLPSEPLRARGGGTLSRLVEVLLQNSAAHSRGPVSLAARREAEAIVVTVQDSGEAIANELRDRAFTVAGQHDIKQRNDGRYSRVAGLFAARLLADAISATLSAGGERGAAWFRVRLEPLD